MIPSVKLANGVEMPQLLLGTAHLLTNPGGLEDNPTFTGFLPERLYRSLQLALEAGIRGIDTGLIYRTHSAIREVLGTWFASGKLSRHDIFLTTKVYHGPAGVATTDSHTPNMDSMTPEQVTILVTKQCEQVLVELGMGYVDLLLLHWPATFKSQHPLNPARRLAAWKVLESMYERGWARAIGVSNFSEHHLERLMTDGATIRPMVNQIESSVYLQFPAIVEYCQRHDIVLQAYSPLGRGLNDIALDPVVNTIATKHNRDAGQIAMRFLVQRGYTVTFLSSSQERLQSNQEIFAFTLDDDDMTKLSTLKRPDGSWGLPEPYTMT